MELANRLRDRTVLVAGATGRGKSTLVTAVADAVGRCAALCADPGQPAFGPPGAVSWAERRGGAWLVRDVEGLGTLDAGRHRVALLLAVKRLVDAAGWAGPLLVDAPGLVRGPTAADLLLGLAGVTRAAEVWLLRREGDPVDDLAALLEAAGTPVRVLDAADAARPVSRGERWRRRTAAWDAHLVGAEAHGLVVPVSGTPSPGRQAVVLGDGRTLAVGEIVGTEPLVVRAPPFPVADARAVIVRDASRLDGGLGTVPDPRRSDASADVDRRPEPTRVILPAAASSGTLAFSVVGGLFDDPLVHVRVLHDKRSLLLDLGEPTDLGTMSLRLANQVSDVFVTHAHMDHFSGFLWLIRRRVGNPAVCRLYGPAGLADRVEAFARAWTWDRIGDTGPRFDVHELSGGRVRTLRVQAGVPGPAPVAEREAPHGVLLDEALFRVRAAELDHGGTPVLAFAVEEAHRMSVRKERLAERGLAPGKWVGRLKERFAAGDPDAIVELPDGARSAAGELAADLLIVSPGTKLAYATDLADTPANRAALADLARGADVFLCEASFRMAEADRAVATGHLTTAACAAIAAEAGVKHLVPFHFSARYEDEPSAVVREVRSLYPRTFVARRE